MSTPRSFPGSVVVEDSICVFGGKSTGYDYSEEQLEAFPPPEGFQVHGEVALDSAEELDLETGVWKPLPRMPDKTDQCFAFLLCDPEHA